jgi:NAD(P)-dependent dehydrogenase (short-subunit alcohol dehydrogenase family)
MPVLENKVAVITGGTRGLGLAMAHAYASEGARVIIGSRTAAAVDQALETLRSEGLTVDGQACDVANIQDVGALADLATRLFGRIDIWVNNAGISGPYGPTIDLPSTDFDAVVKTNILGTYYGSLSAMRHFISQGSGKLINIIGAGAKQPIPYQNVYASSKAWIRNFSLALAKEVNQSGIEVIIFQPGLMDTEFVRKIDVIQGYEKRLKPFAAVIQMLGKEPGEVAEKAVWLASSATDGKNGLQARSSGMLAMLGQVANHFLRRLTGRARPVVELDITLIPPDRKNI